MIFSSPALKIKVINDSNLGFRSLHFKFLGKFTRDASVAGSSKWAEFMDENSEEQFEFVWDCIEMNGFEIAARTEWYKTIKMYKDRMRKVQVISNNIMIRSAAKVMLQFFNVPSDIIRSKEPVV
ncbi:MAG: hypothetical protein AB8B73_16475 [Ekhidna sp.]